MFLSSLLIFKTFSVFQIIYSQLISIKKHSKNIKNDRQNVKRTFLPKIRLAYNAVQNLSPKDHYIWSKLLVKQFLYFFWIYRSRNVLLTRDWRAFAWFVFKLLQCFCIRYQVFIGRAFEWCYIWPGWRSFK